MPITSWNGLGTLEETEGIDIATTRKLFKRLTSFDPDLIASTLHKIHNTLPSHFCFDTSTEGYASVEFPLLPNTFPPNQGGYTFCTWLHAAFADEDSHITLFGAFDTSQNSFTMLYIEKGSNCLVLQTSLRASVRFRSYVFTTGKWYHIAIVHKRPRSTVSSRATLYVNGEAIETIKVAYPLVVAPGQLVQAFVGTPECFTSGTPRVRYHLGQTILVGQLLTAELINLYSKLGADYSGNYQDVLGGYMTYRSSSAINFEIEKHDEPSELKSRNCENMPEHLVILSIAGEQFSTAHRRGLSKDAIQFLRSCQRKSIKFVALNKAVPQISVALTAGAGVGYMTGGASSVMAASLADNIYKIGGVGILLFLVEKAINAQDVVSSVNVCLSSIATSWRNSEDMERVHGYEILSYLLKQKSADCICEDLLAIVLRFVGIEEEIITNPLAYRFLLVDFEIWRRGNEHVQKTHLNQFTVFSTSRKYGKFNNRRLGKMHIIKKFLSALRNCVPSPILADYIDVLKGLVELNFSTDVVRSLATYVVYSLHLSIDTKTADHTSASEAGDPSVTEKQQYERHSGLAILDMLRNIVCDFTDISKIQKFATTITNRWSLLLLSNQITATNSLKILSRLLITQGPSYVAKFGVRNHGFQICKHLLADSSDPSIWIILIAMMFDLDCQEFSPTNYSDLTFVAQGLKKQRPIKVAHPEVFSVIKYLLKRGVHRILARSHGVQEVNHIGTQPKVSVPESAGADCFNQIETLDAVLKLLLHIHSESQSFRQFCRESNVAEDILAIVYPLLSTNNRSALRPDRISHDRRSNPQDSTHPAVQRDHAIQILDSAIVDKFSDSQVRFRSRGTGLRRGSSYVLLPSTSRTPTSFTSPQFKSSAEELENIEVQTKSNHMIVTSMDLLVTICADAVLSGQENASLIDIGLNLPPGLQENHVYFETYVWQKILSRVSEIVRADLSLLSKATLLTSITKFSQDCAVAVYRGSHIGGYIDLFEFVGTMIEQLEISVHFPKQHSNVLENSIAALKKLFYRLVLFQLSDLADAEPIDCANEETVMKFLGRLMYWQQILLSYHAPEQKFFKLFCYQLYIYLVDRRPNVQLLAADIWRIALIQKPSETIAVLQAGGSGRKSLTAGFNELLESDSETFLRWVCLHRNELDSFFVKELEPDWEAFAADEYRVDQDTLDSRLTARKEKLRALIHSQDRETNIMKRHSTSSQHWYDNIYNVESTRHKRVIQDLVDHVEFLRSSWTKLRDDLTREAGIYDDEHERRWRLNMVECRYRMRKKLQPNNTKELVIQPRAGQVNFQVVSGQLEAMRNGQTRDSSEATANECEPDYEIIEDRQLDTQIAVIADEDKNRKVIRSLEHGDVLLEVFNISRITGLNACEGLMIFGKERLYLIDNYFQRSDGEVCDVWDPSIRDERDPYLQLLSGQDNFGSKPVVVDARKIHETRSWPYAQMSSASKRRFLHRDVALELFFKDGRSFLVTTLHQDRDLIHAKIISCNQSLKDDAVDASCAALPKASSTPFGNLSHKLVSAFSPAIWTPATKKWERGEISNFQYLMIVNSMAGRTYNDLTQYPIFPWILADYTSEELNLSNRSTFRDLSKPMGCQSEERREEFISRYNSFAELHDTSQPPFHYGTHYSSAMIVCSYLIRIVPFVESYLLLQGGQFDHPDRLFHSIERTWLSASRDNMPDVRELTPEFFYLPEFLRNTNNFEFGAKQVSGEKINDVILPPWAKGDPNVFIEKHREALESKYVSEHLSEWIDLIFGYKQVGEEAVKATNVFHHLSYHGSIDLDKIDDPIERLATIGIIHNFGQTPRQVFSKPHPRRNMQSCGNKFDYGSTVRGFVQMPSSLVNLRHSIGSIVKAEHVTAIASNQLQLKFPVGATAEWYATDNSLRVYGSTKTQIGVFESLHAEEITVGTCSERSVILGSRDTTLSVWTVKHCKGHLALHLEGYLRGHTNSITSLAWSQCFSLIVSGSEDGTAILWDFNRLEFVRTVHKGSSSVQAISTNEMSGDIAICAGNGIYLYTVNGDLLLQKTMHTGPENAIVCCAFYSGTDGEWARQDLIVSGHKSGVINIWSKVPEPGFGTIGSGWSLRHEKVIKSRETSLAETTALLFTGNSLCVGDINGRIFVFQETSKR